MHEIGCITMPLRSCRLMHACMQQEHATETEETCTQYNMLKIARYLFRWTGAPAFADYYERAILNGKDCFGRAAPVHPSFC